MSRRLELPQLRRHIERQIAETDSVADALGALGAGQQGDGPVLDDDLRCANELKRQLRVLLADCERQLQREC